MELATKSGVAVSTIKRLESGVGQPHGQTVRKLADALEVAPEQLTDEDSTRAFGA